MAHESEREATRWDVGGATHVGRVRQDNEDALLVLPSPAANNPTLLIAVADGMGGHNAGEVASALAIDALGQAVYRAPEAANAASDALLKRAVQWANQVIWQAGQEDAANAGMGTTLVCALLLADGTAVVANVGDSRAYLIRQQNAELVTVDHSWVMERVLAGDMTPADAEASPFRSVLTRSLGVEPRVEVDLFPNVRLDHDEALVLCSDGVTTYLDERDLQGLLAQSKSAQEAADSIVHASVERGGSDNATAVVARRT